MDVDSTIHRVALSVGSAVLIAGVVLMFFPDAAMSLPIGLLVADLTAIVALLLVIWIVRQRYHAVPLQTVVPEIEYGLTTPTPGDDLDEMVYRLTRLREATIEYREQIRERVSEVAITVIMQREDCSREYAIQRLQEGTWTDDAVAAGFFTGEGGESPNLFTQIRRRLTDSETAYERQLDRTVRAITRRAPFAQDDDEETETDDVETRGVTPDSILRPDDGQWVSETVRHRGLCSTRHWMGITAFALLALSVGVFSGQPAPVLSSVAALAAVGYSRIGLVPSLTSLDVTRSISDESPEPGDEVEATVTVENTGDSFLTDLRLIDRIPATTQIVDGRARLGTALRPGQSATFEYTLVADRGEHEWPLQVIARDPSGATEREAFVSVDTVMECVPRLKTATETPVRMQTSMYAGQVNTDSGGDGLEFFSVREYQPGDPMRRIDWKTYARTGEFSTIDFRKERAAKVVLMFDAREAAYVSSGPGKKHALERSVSAAYDVFASLHDAGHLVGTTAFDTVSCWLGPSTGDQHVERMRRLFVEHPAIHPLPPSVVEKDGRHVDPMNHIRRQLPMGTQIFLFSPLTEDYVYEVARRLDGAGHLVTVISPDPTADRTVGQRLARLSRKARIVRLREHGIRVIDWSPTSSLRLEFERAIKRW